MTTIWMAFLAFLATEFSGPPEQASESEFVFIVFTLALSASLLAFALWATYSEKPHD